MKKANNKVKAIKIVVCDAIAVILPMMYNNGKENALA